MENVLKGAGGRWRLGWRVLSFLVLFLGLATVGLFLFPLPGIPGGTLPLLVAAILAGWILLAVEGRPPGALGFHASRAAARESIAGLTLGAGVALLAVLLIAAAGGVGWSTASAGEGATGAFLSAAVAALWLFAVPAFAEEALFRGYPLQALAESWGPGAALMATSAGFALIHMGNPNVTGVGLVNILAAGVFLGAVYLRTASLWWASGVHLGWNWAHGFLVGLPVSGLELVDNPLVEAAPRGPEWISGGAFGPEGSALSALVLAVASVWIWRTAKIRPEGLGEGALRNAPLWAERMRTGDRRHPSNAGEGGQTVIEDGAGGDGVGETGTETRKGSE